MKRILLLLITLFNFTWAVGQSSVTATLSSEALVANNDLIRPIGSGKYIAHGLSGTDSNQHYFAIVNNLFLTHRISEMNLAQMFASNGDKIVVKDMRVLDNKCYCCGYHSHEHAEPMLCDDDYVQQTPSSYQGFILFFDIGELQTGGGSIYYYHVTTVDSLSRMAVYNPRSATDDIIIAAIGQKDDAPRLVELHHQPYSSATNNWTIYTMTTDAQFQDETFYDVAVSDNKLRVVSGVDMVTDAFVPYRNKFVVYTSMLEGFYHSFLEIGNSVSGCYFPDLPSMGTARQYMHQGHGIHMCSTAGDSCCLAFAACHLTNENLKPVLLYLDPENQPIDAAIYLVRYESRLHDIVFEQSSNAIAALVSGYDRPNRELIYAPHQFDEEAFRLEWNNVKLGSVTSGNAGGLSISGVSSTGRLQYGFQSPLGINETHPISCITIGNLGAIILDCVRPQSRSFGWEMLDDARCMWGWTTYTSEDVRLDVPCYKINNQ